MSAAADIRDTIAANLRTMLGDQVQVITYAGEVKPDDIKRVATRGVAVFVGFVVGKKFEAGGVTLAEYTYSVSVVTSAGPGARSPRLRSDENKLVAASDAALTLAEPIAARAAKGKLADGCKLRRAEDLAMVDLSGGKGPLGAGFGFVHIKWNHLVEIPAEVDIASLAPWLTTQGDIDMAPADGQLDAAIQVDH